MPTPVMAYRVLIASPSDVITERTVLEELIHEWNVVNSQSKQIVLLPVKWETHSYPSMRGRPQEILNKQIVENSDILFGVFWARVGTNTGVAESGTLEEIMHFLNSGKPAQLYFSLAPIPRENLDTLQIDRLEAIKCEFFSKGLVCEYRDVEDFKEKVRTNLAMMVNDLQRNLIQTTIPKNNDENSDEAIAKFNKSMLKYESIWHAEKTAGIENVSEGKALLNNIFEQLAELSATLSEENTDIQSILIRLRELRQHQFVLDGGESYRTFWDKGTLILQDLKIITAK